MFGLIGIFLILAITTVIILFNTSIVSTQPPPPMTCLQDSECPSGLICINGECTAEGDIILRLSSATNAHGEIVNGGGSYQFGISYSSIFGIAGSGNRTCTGANKVVGLSSDTNAHAEEPLGTIYTTTEVCYEGLNCVERAGGCQAGESLVVSLSSSTNAHLSNSAGYGVDICCTIAPSACSFDSASWSVSTVQAGNTVQLNVVTSNCDDGETVTLDIGEVDLGSDYAGKDDSDTAKINVNQTTGTISGNSLNVFWIAEWHLDENNLLGDDDPEYVFQATLDSDSGVKIDNSGELKVTPAPIVCDLTSASWSTTNAIEGDTVELIVVGDNCDGETVYFELWEDEIGFNDRLIETRPDDHIPPIDVAFNGTTATGNWTAEWFDDGYSLIDRNSDPEYYFGAMTTSDSINSGTTSAEELHVSEATLLPCENIVVCSDYDNRVSCDDDQCEVAEVSAGDVDCDDPNKTCMCSWNITSSECGGIWTGTTGGIDIGTCSYGEDTSDDCDDGFLTFSWTATWVWDSSCDATCQSENQDTRNECVPGSKTIECPAQIPLPFFGFYNFVVALAIIALIYILRNSNHGKKKRKRS